MLYITTPCSRPENLEIISKTIPKECYWAVVYDNKVTVPKIENAHYFKCEDTGFVGASGRNYFLDNFQINDEDWIYSLDDDNIVHKNWYESIEPLLSLDISIIHWGQLNKDESIRLNPIIKLNHIDAACFMTKWKYNKHIRYNTEKYEYDGLYALECLNNGPSLTLNQYISFYNYLK